ncbi:MAG: DUF1552 domain-containing protein [Planctomycetota bacterium]
MSSSRNVTSRGSSLRMSRRTMLRGTGVALGLPWLEAMNGHAALGGETPPAAQPRRMAALFFPNGVRADKWTPETTGEQWELTPQLQPLAACKSDVSVLSGLWNQGSKTGDGHYAKDAPWLTGTTIRKTTGVNLSSGGVSVDQIAARHLGQATPLRSLELGTEPVRVGVDKVVGYTRVYGAHIAWRTPTQPLSKEIDPRAVFDRLTRIASGKASGRSNRPVLDAVMNDVKQLQRQLSSRDTHRLDEYLHSVRSLEQRLANQEEPSRQSWQSRVDLNKRTPPPSEVDQHAERVRLMIDMMALSFEADITRVSTFMFGNGVSSQNFAFLDGVTGSHHEMSHHQNKDDKLDQYERIVRWHVEQFAYLIQRLGSLREGDSTVLENSSLLFGSSLRDGNSHSPHDLPLLLAGQAGGRLNSGLHVRSTKDSPMANLMLTMLHGVGVQRSHFADSTGKIDDLINA